MIPDAVDVIARQSGWIGGRPSAIGARVCRIHGELGLPVRAADAIWRGQRRVVGQVRAVEREDGPIFVLLVGLARMGLRRVGDFVSGGGRVFGDFLRRGGRKVARESLRGIGTTREATRMKKCRFAGIVGAAKGLPFRLPSVRGLLSVRGYFRLAEGLRAIYAAHPWLRNMPIHYPLRRGFLRSLDGPW